MHRFSILVPVLFFLLPVSQAEAFGVQPALQDILVSVGEKRVERITVVNTETVDQTVFLSTKTFSEGGTAGAVQFNEEDGCSSWFSLPEAVRVPASSRAQIPVSIQVPEVSDEVGSACQVAVLLSRTPSVPDLSKQQVSIDASIASLFFLTRDGSQKDSAVSVVETVWPPDKIYRMHPLTDVSIVLKNTGKTIVLPKITLTATDLFGRILWRTELNTQHQRLLVGSTRSFHATPVDTSLPVFLFGPISWSVNVQDQYGQPLAQQNARNLTLSFEAGLTLLLGGFVTLFLWRRQRSKTVV